MTSQLPKIAVPLKPFQEALRLIGKVAPSKPSLPILSSVLLQIREKELILSSTDLYFGVKTKIFLSSSFEAEAAIPASSLRDMISSFDSEIIYLQFFPESLLVEANGSQVKFAINSPADFPEFPDVEEPLSTLSLEAVNQINQKVCFAAGVDQARPVLTGLLLNFSNQQIEAVATDGFRLSILKLDDKKSQDKESLLVPARFFSEVSRMATSLQAEEIKVFINKEQRQLKFVLTNTEIFVRLLEGEYPPYEKIIPDRQGINSTYLVQADLLLKELKRAQVMAREESNIVELKTDDTLSLPEEEKHNKERDKKSSKSLKSTSSLQHLIVSTQTTTKGVYQGQVPLERKSQGNQGVALNINYLQDFLQNINVNQVRLDITDSLKPLLITAPDDNSLIYVVMPFRINS